MCILQVLEVCFIFSIIIIIIIFLQKSTENILNLF